MKVKNFILTKRLTQKQKEEIVKSFESGKDIEDLSQKYSCTNSTIIRNLKRILGELKYKELINKSKFLKEKIETNKKQTKDSVKDEIITELSDNLGIMGASMGGLISLNALIELPDKFGFAGSFSTE